MAERLIDLQFLLDLFALSTTLYQPDAVSDRENWKPSAENWSGRASNTATRRWRRRRRRVIPPLRRGRYW